MKGFTSEALVVIVFIAIISLLVTSINAQANITNTPNNTNFTMYAAFTNKGISQLVSLNDSAKNQGNQSAGYITGMAVAPLDPSGPFYQLLYVANTTNKSLDVYWAANGTIYKSLNVGTFPNRVAVSSDGTKVAVTLNATNKVAVINTQTWVITNVSVGTNPMGVAFNPLLSLQQLAVCNPGSNSITLINTTTLAVNKTINFNSTMSPWGIVYTGNGSLALVTTKGDTSGVTMLNMATRTFVWNTTNTNVVNPGYVAITPDDQFVYMTSEYLSTNYSVVRMGVLNKSFTRYSAVATTPYDIAVSSDGTQVYCTSNGTVPAGFNTCSLARIYVSNGTVTRSAPFNNGTALASPPSAGSFGFASINMAVNDNASVLTVMINRSGGMDTFAQVSYGAVDGTATNGANYTLTNGTLTFLPTVKSMAFNISLTQYPVYDINRTFAITLYNPTNGSLTSTTNSTANVTIICKSKAAPVIQFNVSRCTFNESDGIVSLTVNKIGTTNINAIINYSTANGTAKSPINYQATNGQLIFQPTDTNKTISISLMDDGIYDGQLFFYANLSLPAGISNCSLGSNKSILIYVNDTDQLPRVQFNVSNYTCDENTGNVMITVTKTGASSSNIRVNYTTLDGTAMAGMNYVPISGMLTFIPGQTNQTFNVTLIDDGVNTSQLFFNVSLINPNGCTILTPNATVYENNVDSSRATYNEFSFGQSSYNAISGSQIAIDVNDNSFNYCTPIIIGGSRDGALANYQVRIDVYNTNGSNSGNIVYLNGHSQEFPNDIRLVDQNGKPLPYWLDDNGNSTYASVWINVTNIPAWPGIKTIYMYYGAPTAKSLSNGTAVFPFFDDFSGTTLSSQWITGSNNFDGGYTVNNSLTITGASTTESPWDDAFWLESVNPLPTSCTIYADTSFSGFIGYSSTTLYSDDQNAVSACLFSPNNAGFIYMSEAWEGEGSVMSGYASSSWCDWGAYYSSPNYVSVKAQYLHGDTNFFYPGWSDSLAYTLPSAPHAYLALVPCYRGCYDTVQYRDVYVTQLVQHEPNISSFQETTALNANGSINYTTTDGTITQPSNYTNTTGILTFSQSDFSKNILVPINTSAPNGYFYVNLSSPVNGTILTPSVQIYIQVKICPNANFSSNVTTGTDPFDVQLNDTSTGYPAAWNWDFGDGTSNSTMQNPVHQYVSPGIYSVILTVSNINGSSTYQRNNYIIVNQAPIANFTSNVTYGCTPLIVQFNDTSIGDPCAWNWSFGDGPGNFTTQNVTHTFSCVGNYTVTLTVTNANGTNTKSISGYIDAIQPLATNFTSNITSGNAPLSVQFNDTSTGFPTNWNWNLGDGSGNFTTQNVTHTFSSAGVYNVSLNTSNANGQSSLQKTSDITVNTIPSANFTSNIGSGAVPLSVQFNDTTIGWPTVWNWNFGDGTGNLTTRNVSHTFTSAGIYNVTLTVTNNNGSSTLCRYGYVTVGIPVADFAANIISSSQPLNIQFNDTSTGNPTTWNWTFGDGTVNDTNQNPLHQYHSPGIYTVILTVTNPIGSSTLKHIYSISSNISNTSEFVAFSFSQPSYSVSENAGNASFAVNMATYKIRQAIYINGSNDSALDYYQISIDVYNTIGVSSGNTIYLYGNSMNFPSDILFTDQNGNMLSYWLETGTHNSTYARLWVNVTNIPAGMANSTKIYIYYGNPTAQTLSDGNQTFQFFDDFNSDLSKWDTSSGGSSIIGGALSINGTWPEYLSIKSLQTFSSSRNFALEARVKPAHVGPSSANEGFELKNSSIVYCAWFAASDLRAPEYANYNNRWGTSSSMTGMDTSNWHTITTMIHGQDDWMIDGANRVNNISNYTTANDLQIRFLAGEDYDAQVQCDWVMVRNYTCNEPAIIAGPMEFKNQTANSIYYCTTDGTAIQPLDYIQSAGVLNFSGSGAQSFNVPIVNNGTFKWPYPYFNINLNNSTGIVITPQAQVTIVKANMANASGFPLFALSPSYQVDKDAGNISIQVYDTPYLYRQAHYINGSPDSPLNNYQFPIEVYNTYGTSTGSTLYLNGNSLNFPNDVIFADQNGTPLSYYIDMAPNTSIAANSTYARFWVNVTNIPQGTSNSVKIYAYYGNSIASTMSNGTTTFPFFDNFGSRNSKWSVNIPTLSWSTIDWHNGYAEMTAKSGDINGASLSTVNGQLFRGSAVMVRYNAYCDADSGQEIEANMFPVNNAWNLKIFKYASGRVDLNDMYWLESPLNTNFSSDPLATLVYRDYYPYTENTLTIPVGAYAPMDMTAEIDVNLSGAMAAYENGRQVWTGNTSTRGTSQYTIKTISRDPNPGWTLFTRYDLFVIRNFTTNQPVQGSWAPEEVGNQPATVYYFTSDGTAVQPFNYTSTSGSLTYNHGGVQSFIVPIINSVKGVFPYLYFYVNINSLNQSMVLSPTSIVTITNAFPVASFTLNTTDGYTPMAIQFNDTSTGWPTAWNWSFGDGMPNSTQQNPMHVYNATGSYSAVLTVTNSNGTSTMTGPMITIGANFSANTTSGQAPVTVQFNDLSAKTTTTWNWSFGDGTPNSTLQNPAHTYVSPGVYTVTLTTTDNASHTSALRRTNYMTAIGNFPVDANITLISGSPTSMSPITANLNCTTPGTTWWNWDLGDGNNSALRTLTHQYDLAGSTTIKLTAGNSSGSGSHNYIVELPMISNWDAQTDGTRTVQFYDNSFGKPSSWDWDFGDGTADSHEQNPVHTFASNGYYNVKLTATNSSAVGGQKSASRSWPILVPSNGVICTGSSSNGYFTPSVTIIYLYKGLGKSSPPILQFNVTSPGMTHWFWDFDDGTTSSLQTVNHTYYNEGHYDVALTCGNSTSNGTVIIKMVIPPFVNANAKGDGSLTVKFYDSSFGNPTAWDWNFGDGSNDSYEQNPVHTFPAPGDYQVLMTAINSSAKGGMVSASGGWYNSSWPEYDLNNSNLTVPFTGTAYMFVQAVPIENGNFETGNFSQWTADNSGVDGGPVVSAPTFNETSYDGAYVCNLGRYSNNSDRRGSISQTVMVDGFKSLDYWYFAQNNSNNSSDGEELTVYFDDTAYPLIAVTGQWTQVRIPLKSFSGNHVIRFQSNYGANIDVDHIALNKNGVGKDLSISPRDITFEKVV